MDGHVIYDAMAFDVVLFVIWYDISDVQVSLVSIYKVRFLICGQSKPIKYRNK